jgi:hypothetical protein
MNRVATHVPMVAGLAYRESLARLPNEFTATLKPEPTNPYNPKAVAVYGPYGKIGYVAPEVARHCYDEVMRRGEAAVPARRAPGVGPATGVEALLDLTSVLG